MTCSTTRSSRTSTPPAPAPSSLVTTFGYDFNENLIKITKPLGNTIEYDYDERNLKIATRVGGPTGSVTIMAYDGNKNLTDVIGPATRGTPAQTLTGDHRRRLRRLLARHLLRRLCPAERYDGFDRQIASDRRRRRHRRSTPSTPAAGPSPPQTLGSARRPDARRPHRLANVPLASGEVAFDEAGRAYETQQDVFLESAVLHGSLRQAFPPAAPSPTPAAASPPTPPPTTTPTPSPSPLAAELRAEPHCLRPRRPDNRDRRRQRRDHDVYARRRGPAADHDRRPRQPAAATRSTPTAT